MRLIFLLFILTTSAFAHVENMPKTCDQKRILTLMAQKGLIDIDPKKNNTCVVLDDLPSVRVKLDESGFALGDATKGTVDSEQDQNLIGLINFLNPKSDGSINIAITGYADGVRNIGDAFDEQIKDMMVGDTLLIDKLKKSQSSKDDEDGLSGIIEFLKKEYDLKPSSENSIKFKTANISSKIKNIDQLNGPDKKLISMMRNFLLSQERAKKLCERLEQKNCDGKIKSRISPNLESGKGSFEGACPNRRGAIIDLVAKDGNNMSLPGSGEYSPPFKSPSREFQGKLQMAASLSVMDFKFPNEADNMSIDQAYKAGKLGDEKKLQEYIDLDRKRFRDALGNSACAKNDYAIDSARRIWWGIKQISEKLPKDLKEAVEANNFEKVYELYSQQTNPSKEIKDLYNILFFGGNSDVDAQGFQCSGSGFTKVIRTGSPEVWNLDQCLAVWDMKDPFFTDRLGFKEILKNNKAPMLDDLFKSVDKINKTNNDLHIIRDINKPGYVFIFDKATGENHFFTVLDKGDDLKKKDTQRCAISTYAGITSSNAETFKSVVEKFQEKQDIKNSPDSPRPSIDCLYKFTGQEPKKMVNEFFPEAKRIHDATPTDGLNCLSAAKAVKQELKNKTEASKMQKPLCQVEKDNQLAFNFNVDDLEIIHSGHKGFMCKACGSGIFYDKSSGEIKYKARTPNASAASLTWEQSLEDSVSKNQKLSFGNMKNLKSYVIPNCAKVGNSNCEDACSCLSDSNVNIDEILKNDDVITIDFTKDLKKTSLTPDLKGIDVNRACIFTPPVPHTCSYDPTGNKADVHHSNPGLEVEQSICKRLEEYSGNPLQALGTGKVLSEQIDSYIKRCESSAFPASEADCLAKPSSSTDKDFKVINH